MKRREKDCGTGVLARPSRGSCAVDGRTAAWQGEAVQQSTCTRDGNVQPPPPNRRTRNRVQACAHPSVVPLNLNVSSAAHNTCIAHNTLYPCTYQEPLARSEQVVEGGMEDAVQIGAAWQAWHEADASGMRQAG